MILGVIGVALVAAILTYVVLRTIDPPERQVQAPPLTTPAASTTTTTLPEGPPITNAELVQLIERLVPFVEDHRQLTFVTPPSVVLDDDATYDEALRTYLGGADGMLQRLDTPFELLGLNPNDAEMTDALVAFHGDKTVVFYDTVHNLVHVRAVPATPYLSAVLVVGLTEHLNDQHFETDAIATPGAYGDATFGLATLVGGDAWRIAAAWADTQSATDQDQIRAELQARRGNDADTAQVPSALASWLRYPAEGGVTYTANLVTSQSSAPLDATFADPPDGSAQVLAPARLAAEIGQLDVAVPEVEGTVESSGTFGRFFLEAMMAPVVDEDTLALAMNGYRGDTLVIFENDDGQSCARLDVTTGDAAIDNTFKALTEWAAQRNGSVTSLADPDRTGRELVRLDVCSPGGGNTGSTTTTAPGGPSGTDPSTTIPRGPRP